MKKKNKKKKDRTKTFSFKEVSIVMVFTILLGIFIGVFLGYTIKTNFSYDKYSTNYEEIIDTYQNIKSNYYKEIDDDALLEAAVKGMIDELDDDYSEFLDTEETEDLNTTLENQYIGIGCSIIEEDGKILIYEVYEDSPANGYLKPNDQLIKIDDQNIEGKDLNTVSLLMSGKENTNVKITVKRDNEEKTYTFKRTKVENKTISSKIEKNIGIIRMDAFTENTTQQFKDELETLEKKNIKGLVLDLRDNIGGYISSAGDIASIFLKKGQVLYQLEKKGLKSNVKDTTREHKDIKVVVLVNKNTASSAEVLTSALKEQYGAIVVGEKTYGKGSVQKVYTLSNGSSYKYTIEKWNTSKGKTVDKVGITPDIKINNADKSKEDNQLQEAIKQFD